jgi:hypothetical protein
VNKQLATNILVWLYIFRAKVEAILDPPPGFSLPYLKLESGVRKWMRVDCGVVHANAMHWWKLRKTLWYL